MIIVPKSGQRRYLGVRGRRPDKKQQRQDEALVRQAAYDKMTPAEKEAKSLRWERRA